MKHLLLTILSLVGTTLRAAEDPIQCTLNAIPSMVEPGARTMELNGVNYRTVEELVAAIRKLPRGSRLVWRTGCLLYTELPLGSKSPMSVEDFRAVCAQSGIRLDYRPGLPRERLVTKAFSIANPPPDLERGAKPWLESQGVAFSPKAGVAWQPAKHRLLICNTEENVELVELIAADLNK